MTHEELHSENSDWEGFGGNFTPSIGEAERTRANREARRQQDLRMQEASEWEGFGASISPRVGEHERMMNTIAFRTLSMGEMEPRAWEGGVIMQQGEPVFPEQPSS